MHFGIHATPCGGRRQGEDRNRGLARQTANGAQLSIGAVIAHARRNLSSFKVPTVIRLQAESELPMLPTGKVDRQGLVSLLARD